MSPKFKYYSALAIIGLFLIFTELKYNVESWPKELMMWLVLVGAFFRLKLAVSLVRIPLYFLLFVSLMLLLMLFIPTVLYSLGLGDHTAKNDALFEQLALLPIKAALPLACIGFVIFSLVFSPSVRRYLANSSKDVEPDAPADSQRGL